MLTDQPLMGSIATFTFSQLPLKVLWLSPITIHSISIYLVSEGHCGKGFKTYTTERCINSPTHGDAEMFDCTLASGCRICWRGSLWTRWRTLSQLKLTLTVDLKVITFTNVKLIYSNHLIRFGKASGFRRTLTPYLHCLGQVLPFQVNEC